MKKLLIAFLLFFSVLVSCYTYLKANHNVPQYHKTEITMKNADILYYSNSKPAAKVNAESVRLGTNWQYAESTGVRGYFLSDSPVPFSCRNLIFNSHEHRLTAKGSICIKLQQASAFTERAELRSDSNILLIPGIIQVKSDKGSATAQKGNIDLEKNLIKLNRTELSIKEQ